VFIQQHRINRLRILPRHHANHVHIDRSAAATSETLAAFNIGWIDYEQSATKTPHGATTLNAVLSRLSSN